MMQGKWENPGRSFPTLEDVARLAGVSTATVSRSLNTPQRVREETRRSVEAAVEALGYTPNFGGQILASRRSNTIGAVIPTMSNAIFAEALQALQEALASRNVTLLVASSQYQQQQEEAQIRTMLARGVDGLVLIGSTRSADIHEMLAARGIPFALLWSLPGGSPYLTIGFDNKAAASQVASHVLSFGHRHVAMIVGMTEENDRAHARLEGVRQTLAQAGITLEETNIQRQSYTLEAGAAAARTLLSRPDAPTALICGNDVLAAGAMRGARKMGLSIPGGVSVTGFDDIDLATAVSPPLTTVRVPHKRMGTAAAECLLSWIETKEQPQSICLSTQLIHRSSLARVDAG